VRTLLPSTARALRRREASRRAGSATQAAQNPSSDPRRPLAEWSVVRSRPAASFFLHRAQVILILVALLTVILTAPVGVVLLVMGASNVAVLAGILVLAFTAASVVGVVVGSLVLRRGAALVKVQNDFLSLVSHELRTPMTSMRMYVEALRDDRLTDAAERDRCLSVLHREMERMEQLVVRLLELSRMQAQQEPFERELLSMEDVVRTAASTLDAMDMASAEDLTWEIDRGAFVRGDRTALVGAVANLLANAWKYSASPRQIAVRVWAQRDKNVVCEVTDNGPGVPSDERKRIFQAFQRGAAAEQGSVAGSGLGLALVKAVMETHGGSVEARAAEGGGACFRLTLPRAKAPMAAAPAAVTARAPALQDGAREGA